MKPGVGQRALAIAAFGLYAMASAAPAAADTASEIRALKARLSKLEADEARARREARVVHASLPADKGPPPPPPPLHWYERLSLRGYTQMRYNDILSGGPELLRHQHDERPFGRRPPELLHSPRAHHSERRRLRSSVSLLPERLREFSSECQSRTRRPSPLRANVAGQAVYYFYNPGVFSPFRATIRSAVTAHAPGNFAQIRDLYADIYFDKDKEFRVRAGQSKIPYGFENLQSSQNRLALDRADAINTCCKDERDIGLFFYYTPKEMRHLFRDLVKNNLKGSGDYGMVAFGVYNGQGANRIELNKGTHLVARFTYPYVFENGQVVEASVQGYTGRFVPYTQAIRPSLGMATNWAGFVPLNSPYAAIGSGFVPYVNGPGWNSLGNYNLSQYGAVNGWGPAVANGGEGIRDSRVAVTARDLSAALRSARRMELGRRAAAQCDADGHRGETAEWRLCRSQL